MCRSSRPRGWIAIDFVADSTRCAATPGRKNEHTVALVIAFEHYAIGRELEACIGERIPTNWIRTREITDASRCPTDEPDAKPDQPTVVVIRRTK